MKSPHLISPDCEKTFVIGWWEVAAQGQGRSLGITICRSCFYSPVLLQASGLIFCEIHTHPSQIGCPQIRFCVQPLGVSYRQRTKGAGRRPSAHFILHLELRLGRTGLCRNTLFPSSQEEAWVTTKTRF